MPSFTFNDTFRESQWRAFRQFVLDERRDAGAREASILAEQRRIGKVRLLYATDPSTGELTQRRIGVVIDGCPPKIHLDEQTIQSMLDRRRPGGSVASTTRKEPDSAIILSGVFNGMTTGTPIMIMVDNSDADPKAYESNADLFRPGHGDFTYQAKYGIRDWRGGGRASARETVARVAAGAVAEDIAPKRIARGSGCSRRKCKPAVTRTQGRRAAASDI